MAWSVLAEGVDAGMITAIGALLIGVLTLLTNFFMNLRAQDKIEAKATLDAIAATANAKRLDDIAETTKSVEHQTNSAFSKMQEEARQSREELARVNKELAEMAKSLAIITKARAEADKAAYEAKPSQTPTHSSEGSSKIEVKKLDIELVNKPTEKDKEGNVTETSKIEVKKLDVELAKPDKKET